MEEIPVSAVNAYLYCPYRCYIEYVKGQFVTNAHVEEGRFLSQKLEKKVQTKDYKKRPQVFVQSRKYGLYGTIDQTVVKQDKIVIVETKKGATDRPYENDVLQLLAYMVCCSESFEVELEKVSGKLVYLGSQKTFEILPNDELLEKLRSVVESIRSLSSNPPKPQYSRKRCDPCSLINICMPEKNQGEENVQRKIMPTNRLTQPLFVCTQGAYIGKMGESVQVTYAGEELLRLHKSLLNALYLFGNVQVSTHALKMLAESEIPIVFSDTAGRFSFLCFSGSSKNINLRLKQYETRQDPERRLKIAKQIVLGKLKNQLFVLRRKSLIDGSRMKRFKELLRSVESCRSIEELMGVEGLFASEYFDAYSKAFDDSWKFVNRNKRPPTDPINALLSFGYMMLHGTVLTAVLGVGFDPLIGVLHNHHYGRFSLALDLMEEFRPILVDQLVLSLVNLGQIKFSDFVENLEGSYTLTDKGLKKFVQAYKEKLETKHYHPLLKMSVEYARIIEAQARVFEKCILGEISTYIPFTVTK